MDNFIFHNPTRLIFGKGMIAQLSQQIPADKRIMITLYKDAAYHDTFTFGTFAPYAREQKKLIAYS